MGLPLPSTKHKRGNGIDAIRGSLVLMVLVALITITQLMVSVSKTKILSMTIPINNSLHNVNSIATKSSVTEQKVSLDDKAFPHVPVMVATNQKLQVRFSVAKSPAPITGQNSQQKQNRTLVVVLGNIRGGEPTWRSMCRHLLDPNMADLALVIGEGNLLASTNMEPTLLHERAKYIWTVPEFEDWADAMEDIPNKPPDWRKRLFDLPNPYFRRNILLGAANKIPGSGALVLMFRFYLSQIIVKNNFLTMYDRFVVTRSDHYYLCLNDLSELSNEYIWVPTGSDHEGICDRYFVANNETILSTLDILPALVRNPEAYKKQLQSYRYNTERFLLLRWQEEGLEPIIRRFNRTLFVAAGTMDRTRWSRKRRFLKPLGVHLKYPGEFTECVRTCKSLSMQASAVLIHYL
jgi:hypothetical protein